MSEEKTVVTCFVLHIAVAVANLKYITSRDRLTQNTRYIQIRGVRCYFKFKLKK